MNASNNMKNIALGAIVLALSLLRLVIDIPNVNPILALALFGGLWSVGRIKSVIFVVVALLLGDVVLSLVDPRYASYLFSAQMGFVYLCFGLIIFMAHQIRKVEWTNVWIYSVGASILFFLVSNAGWWLTSGMYDLSFIGLILCYDAGVPFLIKEMIGTLIFSYGFMFAGYVLNGKQLPKLATVKA